MGASYFQAREIKISTVQIISLYFKDRLRFLFTVAVKRREDFRGFYFHSSVVCKNSQSPCEQLSQVAHRQ